MVAPGSLLPSCGHPDGELAEGKVKAKGGPERPGEDVVQGQLDRKPPGRSSSPSDLLVRGPCTPMSITEGSKGLLSWAVIPSYLEIISERCAWVA